MKQVKTHCGFSPFNYCNQMTIISFLKNVGDFSSDVVAQRNLMPCSCVEWKFLVCSLHNPPSPCFSYALHDSKARAKCAEVGLYQLLGGKGKMNIFIWLCTNKCLPQKIITTMTSIILSLYEIVPRNDS